MKRLILITLLTLAANANGTIIDVQISPVTPSVLDIITIEIDGGFSQAGNTFDYSVFSSGDFSPQLDLYFTGGIGAQIPTPWFHDEEIGTLSLGNYDLSVQEFWRPSATGNYILHDNYPTTFEVVPEPATLSLLAFGTLIYRRTLS